MKIKYTLISFSLILLINSTVRAQQIDISGSVTLNGSIVSPPSSIWDITTGNPFSIGNQSLGELSISNGGVVNVSNINTTIGYLGGTGILSIDGMGSSFNSSYGGVYLGYNGTGIINITNGGLLDVKSLELGHVPQPTNANVTVDGEGSTANINSLWIGEDGDSVFSATNGSTVTVTGNTYIGVGSTGTVNISGNKTLWTQQQGPTIARGTNSIGTINISDNGTLNTPYLVAGSGLASVNLDGGILQLSTNRSEIFENFNSGSVKLLSNGGTFDTQNYSVGTNINLEGSGELRKIGSGNLTLTGNNTYSGGTVISAGTLQLGSGGNSGSITGNVANNGNLVFNRSDVYEFTGNVTGSGTLEQKGSGTTALSGNNTYSGGTVISAGTLQLGSGGNSGSITGNVANNGNLVFNRSDVYEFTGNVTGSGTLEQKGSGTTALSGNNTYSGGTVISAGTLQALSNSSFSSASSFTVNSGSILDANGFNNTISSLNNKGLVATNDLGSSVGTELTINGDYIGNNGILVLNTVLNDDYSQTDKLIINGNATGSTQLKIKNILGNGAQTIDGIKIIETGSSEKNAFFIGNGGYIGAGAYDYGLFLENNNTDWYLKSHLRNDTPIYNPDVGSYLAVETMGNTLFTSRLEDREGASQYQNLGNKNEGNVWVRASGGHNKFKSMDGQLKTTGNSFVTQIGAGLVTLGEEDQYNLGAMTGFAYYDGKTRSNLTDRESKTKIDGYSLGLYGTWYAHPIEKRGAYIDSWVLWNKFNNKIDTPDQNQYKYDSSGITASIEVGGDYLINKNGQKDWWIQPQAQLIYQGVHADDFKDAQGLDVYHGKDNVQARMGVKTYLNIPTNGNKLTSYRPYVALNFIHNTNPYSVVIDDVRFENEGSANLGELKLGVEGQVTKNSQVWLNASYVAGSHSNQAYQGNIGWKYNF